MSWSRVAIQALVFWIAVATLTNILSGKNLLFTFELQMPISMAICVAVTIHAMRRGVDFFEIFNDMNAPPPIAQPKEGDNARPKPSYAPKQEEPVDQNYYEEDEEEYVNPYATKIKRKPKPEKEAQAGPTKRSAEEAKKRKEARQAKQQEQELAHALSFFGLSEPYSKADVNRTYKVKMRDAHPDLGGTHDDAIRINTARDVLVRHLDQ